MVVHVLAHLVDGSRHAAAEFRRAALRGPAVRLLTVAVSVLAGVGIALALYPSATSSTSHHGFDKYDVRRQ